MNIRTATPDDIRPLSELWARAFPGERTVEQRVRHLETGGVFGGIETAYAAEADGRMIGGYRAYAMTQYMHGTAYRMMGLAAVAVDETARRRGVGRRLCEHAIGIARERGDALSVLYPFRPAFYRALGWGLAGTLHSYRFRPESLYDPGGSLDVVRAGADDVNAIAACYSRVAEASNGLIARTPRVWRSHLEGEGTHVYMTGDGAVRGYMIVRFGRSPSPDDKPLFIREIVAEDTASYESMLAWIAAQRDAWRIIHYDAMPGERFEHRLAEPRMPGFHPARYLWAPTARVLRGPMLRILDVPAALEQRARWGPATPMRFGLRVIDDIVDENNASFDVDFDGGRMHVTRTAAGRQPLLHVPTSTLAQVFAGELSFEAARQLRLADTDGDVSMIDAMFTGEPGFRLLDEF